MNNNVLCVLLLTARIGGTSIVVNNVDEGVQLYPVWSDVWLYVEQRVQQTQIESKAKGDDLFSAASS